MQVWLKCLVFSLFRAIRAECTNYHAASQKELEAGSTRFGTPLLFSPHLVNIPFFQCCDQPKLQTNEVHIANVIFTHEENNISSNLESCFLHLTNIHSSAAKCSSQ